MKVLEFYHLFLSNKASAFAILQSKNAYSSVENVVYARDDSDVANCRNSVLLDYIPPSGDTLVCHFIRKGDAETVKRLIHFGASLKIPDAMGKTPLELAVMSCNHKIVKYFRYQARLPSDKELFVHNDRKSIIYVACVYNVKPIILTLMDKYVISPFFHELLEIWSRYAADTLSFYALQYIAEHVEFTERGKEILTGIFEQIFCILRRIEKRCATGPKQIRMYDNAAECIKILVKSIGLALLNRDMYYKQEDAVTAFMWLIGNYNFPREFKRFIIRTYMKSPEIYLIMQSENFLRIAGSMVVNNLYAEFEKLLAIVWNFIRQTKIITCNSFLSNDADQRFFLGYLNAKNDSRYLKAALVANIGNSIKYISTTDRCKELKVLVLAFYKQITLFDIAYQTMQFRNIV